MSHGIILLTGVPFTGFGDRRLEHVLWHNCEHAWELWGVDENSEINTALFTNVWTDW